MSLKIGMFLNAVSVVNDAIQSKTGREIIRGAAKFGAQVGDIARELNSLCEDADACDETSSPRPATTEEPHDNLKPRKDFIRPVEYGVRQEGRVVLSVDQASYNVGEAISLRGLRFSETITLLEDMWSKPGDIVLLTGVGNTGDDK